MDYMNRLMDLRHRMFCLFYIVSEDNKTRIANQNIANPVAMILCVALMFRYSLDMETEAKQVEDAVRNVLEAGICTPDLGGTAGTSAVGDAIVAALRG